MTARGFKRLTSNRIWQLSYGLSERDIAVIHSLSKIRVASVRQLQRLHFAGSPRTARRVLKELTDRRIIARLRRGIGGVRAGSAGHVYALDVVGQSLSVNGGPAHGRRLRRPWTPGERFLGHALAVSEIYVGLVEREREGGLKLLEFQAEPECWRTFAPIGYPVVLKPDAFVRLGNRTHEDSYFIEVDLGTESRGTLELKARIYLDYFNSGEEQHHHGVFPKVLWIVPDEARKESLRELFRAQNAADPELHDVVLRGTWPAVRPNDGVTPSSYDGSSRGKEQDGNDSDRQRHA